MFAYVISRICTSNDACSCSGLVDIIVSNNSVGFSLQMTLGQMKEHLRENADEDGNLWCHQEGCRCEWCRCGWCRCEWVGVSGVGISGVGVSDVWVSGTGVSGICER